jgi:hypothetical protein
VVFITVSGDLLKHEDCHALLRLCWNVEWFGGVEVVLSRSEVPPNEAVNDKRLCGFAEELRLLAADLRCLKAAALDHRCRQHLCDIQNATTHQAVVESLACISGSVVLAASVLSESLSCRGMLQMTLTVTVFDLLCILSLRFVVYIFMVY